MKRLWCRIVGHDTIRVAEVGLAARPGGMLPSLDGYVTYAPDPDGDHLACQRCRLVIGPSPAAASYTRDGADGEADHG